MISDDSGIRLRLSTIDCNTTPKYYHLTRKINDRQKEKIKQFFKYYTPDKFDDLSKVAGKTRGWMCKSEDLEEIEKILAITETHEKQNKIMESMKRKTSDKIPNLYDNLELSFSK